MSEAIRTAVKAPEAKKENQVSQVQKGNLYQPLSSPVEQILFLQRTIGNQAVQRLMKSGALQAKLRLGAPGDIHEQEADRVAEQVMRMPEPQTVSSSIPYIQMVCQKCENDELKRQPITEDEEGKLQKKSISENERAFFEPRFGQDFSQVRLHTDSRTAVREVNARAFTIGRDIVFGAGQYEPGTTAGRQLLGHELTHTIQQLHLQSDTFPLQRQVQPGTPGLEPHLPPQLTFSYLDFLRMQEERFASVYRYMEENRTALRSLGEWVAAVRRNVPGTADIARAELELAVRQGATRYSINILALPLVPQPVVGVPESQSSGESLSNKLRDLKNQLEHFVETITTYGSPESVEVTLGFSGIETALERSGFRFLWTVGWRGQLGARVSRRVFNGDLSLSINSDWIAPKENPTFSATLQFGPSAPNYTRLHQIFNNAGSSLTNYIRGLIEESHGVSDEQISEAETSIEDMISRISDAADQIRALTPEEEPPLINFSIQAGYGGTSLLPSEGGRPEPPAGFYIQGFLTLHF